MITIIVVSGKGGVGKSTVAVSLATSMSLHGLRTGLIDLDVDSPSVPMITGTTGNDIGITGKLLEPPSTDTGLKVFSIGHLLPSEDIPILWEGTRKERVLGDIFKSCNFSDVECLIIDLPPGTGDELYGVTEILPSVYAIVVTLPQQLSLISVRKAIKALKKYNIQILGIIENMSGIKCRKCGEVMYPFKHGGGRMLADNNGVDFLGELPIMPDVTREADNGSVDTVVNSPEFKKIMSIILRKVRIVKPEQLAEMPVENKIIIEEGDTIEKGGKEGGKQTGKKKKRKEKIRITFTPHNGADAAEEEHEENKNKAASSSHAEPQASDSEEKSEAEKEDNKEVSKSGN